MNPENTEQGLELSNYLPNLIAAINDGAKAAQVGALSLSALAFYLISVAVSITDQDILLAQTTDISQLGLQIAPPAFFLVSPWVLLAIHMFTMVRFDLLRTNLTVLKQELRNVNLTRRSQYVQLLANIEFIMASIDVGEGRKYKRALGFIWWTTVGILPVLAILLLQISALRYQDPVILATQKVAFVLDLILLCAYYLHESAHKLPHPNEWIRNKKTLFAASTVVIVLISNLVWVENVGGNRSVSEYYDVHCTQDTFYCNTDFKPYIANELHIKKFHWSVESVGAYLWLLAEQPLDNGTCQAFRIGCRFLHVGQRILIDQTFPDDVADARVRSQADIKPYAGIHGIDLNYHQLKYADFDDGEYYGADFDYANLTRAYFFNAHIDHSTLRFATLIEANFTDASLIGAKMRYARLYGADFTGAQMEWVDLTRARLSGAHFYGADLSYANFSGANFPLDESHTVYGYNGPKCCDVPTRYGAKLDQANMTDAMLVAADFDGTSLKSTNFYGADLIGATLNGALTTAATFQCALYGKDSEGVMTKFSAHPDNSVPSGMYEYPQQKALWEQKCPDAYAHWLSMGLSNIVLAPPP